EFYYIQMEKYARQAISEGVRNAEDIQVSHDSELLRVLNLHYNRNNHIDSLYYYDSIVAALTNDAYSCFFPVFVSSPNLCVEPGRVVFTCRAPAQVPENFRFVVEQTLREFFKSILAGKDQEQSWKKAIYKIIARLDDNVPEYFKSPNFLEQLE
ncbi:hypothetical protein BIW11_11849, partial [Tropilaelaps mercedesae]